MADQDKTELIIVRRRNYLDVEEKTGVWKIAYADFMTAMMAFFLVMWLISATNQETRESVATYFNPIKLTDSLPIARGINDARRVDPGKAEEGESKQPLSRTGQGDRGDAAAADAAYPASTKPHCSVIPTPCCRKLPVLRRAARKQGPRSIRRSRKD